MPKRKREDCGDDRRKRRIERLEKRLARYRKNEIELQDEAQIPELDPEVSPDHGTPNLVDLDLENVPINDELDSEILTALGESSGGVELYGEKIREEIFNTIKNILIEGLTNQTKDKLKESLLVPSNCKLLDAPKLNIELVGVLNTQAKTRDKLLQERQHEMGLAIASICQVINDLSKKNFDKINIIKRLTDSSRVLSNLHFQYTQIRRKLVNPFLDKNLAESLKENKREAYLYTNLDDSVKSYSAMKRASNMIKPKPSTQVKPASKNYQQLPRRQNPNQARPGGGSFRGSTQPRYQPRLPYKPQDNRKNGSARGRAKYP